MAIIKQSFGSGGAGLTSFAGAGPTLAVILRDVADDLAAVKSWSTTLAAKLNADGGVTDVNYAAIGTVKTVKG